jgi:hypothetical protein
MRRVIWFSGSGAPPIDAGAIEGDLYLDTDGLEVYQRTTTGWKQMGIFTPGGPSGTGAGPEIYYKPGSGISTVINPGQEVVFDRITLPPGQWVVLFSFAAGLQSVAETQGGASGVTLRCILEPANGGWVYVNTPLHLDASQGTAGQAGQVTFTTVAGLPNAGTIHFRCINGPRGMARLSNPIWIAWKVDRLLPLTAG